MIASPDAHLQAAITIAEDVGHALTLDGTPLVLPSPPSRFSSHSLPAAERSSASAVSDYPYSARSVSSGSMVMARRAGR